jgi:hypothetical protein
VTHDAARVSGDKLSIDGTQRSGRQRRDLHRFDRARGSARPALDPAVSWGLALYANAKKMVGFAASFEFGDGDAFAFGTVERPSRISTGICLRKFDDSSGDGA